MSAGTLSDLLHRHGAENARPGSLGAVALQFLELDPNAEADLIWHPITGWGIDPHGLAMLSAWWFGAHAQAPLELLRVARTLRDNASDTPRRLWWRQLGSAYMSGRRAGDRALGADWGALMPLPITDVRRLLGVEELSAR